MSNAGPSLSWKGAKRVIGDYRTVMPIGVNAATLAPRLKILPRLQKTSLLMTFRHQISLLAIN